MTARLADARRSTLEPGDVELIAAITLLSVRTVTRRIDEAHGNATMLAIFGDEWPSDREALRDLTVAVAKRVNLEEEIAEATGLSVRAIRSALKDVHGKTLLGNAIPGLQGGDGEDDDESGDVDDEDDLDGTDSSSSEAGTFPDGVVAPRTPLGKHRVVDVRGDERAIELAAQVSGLTVDDIRTKFAKVHGRTLVQTVLSENWPWTAEALATKTAAIAQRAMLHAEIRWVTRGSKHLVTRRLNSSAGQKLLKNLFWDLWPAEEVEPPPKSVTGEEVLAGTAARTVPVGPPPGLEEPPQGVSVEEGPDTEPPPPGFQPGAFISSRYDVKEEIGRGGFGTTWLAHDRLSARDVVLKVPHEDDGGAIRQELELAFQVVHPNICQAFPDRDDETGQPFLVMQHGGVDLRALLEKGGWKPFPLPLALHVLSSIAEALDHLHSHLVLHLDVSPMNILIDDDDVVRLTDFGASSRARATPNKAGRHTFMAHEITSLHGLWSAPELFQGMGRSRSDQYSLFQVFATLLSGRIPESVADMPRPPFEMLSDAQNEAVRRALSTDPEARFERCGDAARAVTDGVGRVPERVLLRDLETFARDLRARLRREHARPTSTHTTRIGGVMKLGGGVERLLLATYLWLATQEKFDPGVEIRRYQGVRSIHRATGGLLAKLLRERADCASAKRQEVARIIGDLDSPNSRLYRLIRLRNEVAHAGVLSGDLERASADVATLLDEYLEALPRS